MKHCWGRELKTCKVSPHDQLCKVEEYYDKSKVPGSLPLTLFPSFNILQVAEVDLIEGSITIFMELIISWPDPNITYKPKNISQLRVINQYIHCCRD